MNLKILKKIHNKIYRKCFVPLFKLLYLIIPVDKNKILFTDFYGAGYGDNPRCISDEILSRNLDYKVIWIVENDDIPKCCEFERVRPHTFRALYEFSSAKVWVDNVRVRDVKKKKNQILLQTWHAPFSAKLLEKDAQNTLPSSYILAAQYDGAVTDGILSCSSSQTEQYKRAFWLNENAEILEIGLPRNDFLINNKNNAELIIKLKQNLSIDKNAYVIMYAPTFRDNGDISAYKIDYNIVLSTFEKNLAKLRSFCLDFILMLRNTANK